MSTPSFSFFLSLPSTTPMITIMMNSFLSFSLLFLSLLSPSLCQPHGTFIDCGVNAPRMIDGHRWLPDTMFTTSGTSRNLSFPTEPAFPFLSTVRSFPFENNHKGRFCYDVPVERGAKYMIRSIYYYGGINGQDKPPVFDQIVDGTLWTQVNTTEDYANDLWTHYEGVFKAVGKNISFCVASNSHTDSEPFISALEFVLLEDSLYNTTDFDKYAMSLVARHSFGFKGFIIRYPDDPFGRFWAKFNATDGVRARSNTNVSVSGFWNLPPQRVFETELMLPVVEPLQLQWPPGILQNADYYIALYFANGATSTAQRSRVLNITINDVPYYDNLNVTPAGVVVFASKWPLNGVTRIMLTPTSESDLGPAINAGEAFELLTVGRTSLPRDVVALESIRSSFRNPPLDWSGDPCFPQQHRWTGVTCSEGEKIRVIALNLTGMGISGSLSPRLASLTALTDIWLGSNNLSGNIPDLSGLKNLQTLHLNDNQLSGQIHSSLGAISGLRELFLQNNNLTGQVPNSLLGKPGLNLKTYGNPLSSPPPS